MAETLVLFRNHRISRDGIVYEARACGGELSNGRWQGWIEFVPLDDGLPLRTPRETTQPNRVDLEYWATGLTPVYLEGALGRALDAPRVVDDTPLAPPVFEAPAPAVVTTSGVKASAVLNPFSVYEKGEAILRSQLKALSAWHLVNIIRDYELSGSDPAALNHAPAGALVDLIVSSVKVSADQLEQVKRT
jgi:hypothetical protein